MLDLMGPLTQRAAPRAVPADASARYSALLDYAGPLDDASVLLIGSNTLELMCALIRRNCVGVTTRRPGDRPETASADLVLIADLEAVDGQGLAQARRALVSRGSLVLCLPTISDKTYRLVQHELRACGFDAVRFRVLGHQRLLRAEMPSFGFRATA